MFVPLILLKNEKPLVTVQDCLKALDSHIAKRYPTFTTTNAEYTKAECLCILQCYFMAGKILPSLSVESINSAVCIYILDRFWIDCGDIQVRHDLDPKSWLKFS